MLFRVLKAQEFHLPKGFLRCSAGKVAMVAFDRPLGLDFTAAFVAGDHCLGWVSNNNRKIAPRAQ